ncbi:hypothetical protein I4U23_009104 [Adineta vaga]|nr:hypothetical protein I4U23_009104 [Adineta vaga]
MTEPVIIPASEKHTTTKSQMIVIVNFSVSFLHGLDDIGKTWFEEFNTFDIPKCLPYMKFVFPTASIMKISKNNGEEMTSWFDIYGFDQNAKEDQESIEKASELLNCFVEAEIKNGIPVEHIIIGGFSMGGAVALHTALISSYRFGGVLALSTWLPLLTTFHKTLVAGDKKVDLPILHCHGNKDSIIQLNWARSSEDAFKRMGFKHHCLNAARTSSQSEDECNALRNKSAPAIIPATDEQTATVIFLHGLGDCGENWYDAFKIYDIEKNLPYAKFIFPTAPVRKVTLNMGMTMTSWFDIRGLDQTVKEDQVGIEKSSVFLKNLIEEEITNGISSNRIIIGGFSMGGAIALHAALTSPHAIGGVIALSTWLPLASTFPNALTSSDKKVNLPILQCHGTQDPLVQLKWARLTEQGIVAMGLKRYSFREYQNMDHSTCDREMQDVTSFIVQHLPKMD